MPATCPPALPALLAQDNITLAVTNKYGKGLGNSQKTNFAPRFGFAYQVTPKLVARGGFGLFYNGFENRGFSPNLGENYPFQFNFQYAAADDGHPITYPGCTGSGTPIGSATLETGFACTPLDPLLVNAKRTGSARNSVRLHHAVLHGRKSYAPISAHSHIERAGRLRNFAGASFGVIPQFQQRHSDSATPLNRRPRLAVPFPDFGHGSSYAITAGSSYYHGLQTKVEKTICWRVQCLGHLYVVADANRRR